MRRRVLISSSPKLKRGHGLKGNKRKHVLLVLGRGIIRFSAMREPWKLMVQEANADRDRLAWNAQCWVAAHGNSLERMERRRLAVRRRQAIGYVAVEPTVLEEFASGHVDVGVEDG